MRILVSAYACEPGRGSEPGIGWNWLSQISRFNETWVITRANNRENIEKLTEKKPLANVHFVYFDVPRWARFWKRGRRGMYLYYYLWQLGAYFVGKRLHRQVEFGLVHHVTFGKYWAPSFIALLRVPFVWGPVGGGESEPRSLWYSLSARGKLYETVRHLARSAGELDPFVRLTARRAELALATTDQTERRLRSLGCRRVKILTHAALPGEEICRLGGVPAHETGPFRVMSIGDLLHLKGYHLALAAYAKFCQRFPDTEYWLFGEGPERKRLERLAQRLRVTKQVRFWGCIPRSELLAKIAECDVLLHPVLHDSSGWASVEAMAAGRPVVCLDLAGPALQVNAETGVKVPAVSKPQVIEDLAAGLLRLAENPELRRAMGRAARQRVLQRFNWDKKGEEICAMYAELGSFTSPTLTVTSEAC
jgi:glycosyltransferase involved in cell wall biosynthesis